MSCSDSAGLGLGDLSGHFEVLGPASGQCEQAAVRADSRRETVLPPLEVTLQQMHQENVWSVEQLCFCYNTSPDTEVLCLLLPLSTPESKRLYRDTPK